MKTLITTLLLFAMVALLSGCMTVRVDARNCDGVTVTVDKAIDTLPVNATGNTVPVSAIPGL